MVPPGSRTPGAPLTQARLQWIAIPLDPTEQVRRNQVDGIRLRSSSEVVVDHVLAKVASRARRLANTKGRKI